MKKLKILLLQYFDKIAIVIAIALFSYSGLSLYRSFTVSDSIKKIQEYSPVIENNIRTAKVPVPLKQDYTMAIRSEFNKISEEKMTTIVKRSNTVRVKTERTSFSPEEFVAGVTEITFKGGTPDKALIVIKKKEADTLFEQSFVTKPGEVIGANEPVGEKKTTNFLTGCTLLEIINNAKRTLTTKKMLVNVNENGDFISTQTRSEPYKINSIKIKYQNDRLNGEIKELWLGDTANLGTITMLTNTNSSEQ